MRPLSILLALLGFALATPAYAIDAETSAFFTSDYGYCDAKILGAYWGQDITEAKARIGRKIGWGDTTVINQMLTEAATQASSRGSAPCTWTDAGYTYEDAQALARMWKSDVQQAKATMDAKINSGNGPLLRAAVAQARAAAPAAPRKVNRPAPVKK